MVRFRDLRTLVVAAIGLAVAACVSPTLPLPPPEQPDTVQPTADDPDVWVVSGSASPGALITIFDETQGKGVVVEDTQRTGRYSVEIRAKRCDLAWVAQVEGEDASNRTPFVIQERSGGSPSDPAACK